jgi:hypothetical protein
LIGTEVWLDPTEEEARSAIGTLVLSCIPALETVNSVWQTGSMTPCDALAVSLTSIHELQLTFCPPVHKLLLDSVQQYPCSSCSGTFRASLEVFIIGQFNLKYILTCLEFLRTYVGPVNGLLSTSFRILALSLSMSSRSRDEYVVLRSYPQSPPLSPRHSSESDDSLRALEVSQGPDITSRRGRCAGQLPY